MSHKEMRKDSSGFRDFLGFPPITSSTHSSPQQFTAVVEDRGGSATPASYNSGTSGQGQ